METYNLLAADVAGAMTALKTIIEARLGVLPPNASIIYAVVSSRDTARDGHMFDTRQLTTPSAFPLPGTADTATDTPAPSDDPNDVEIAVEIRFETAAGRRGTNFYRCIPDNQIEKVALTAPLVVPAFSGGTFTPLVATTYIARLGNFVATVGTLCQHVRKTSTPGTFDVNPYTIGIPRGCRKKNTGRPFGVQRGRAPVR